MSDTWQPVPRKMPYRCRRTGQDSVAAGPYFEESLGYCEAPGDDREMTLYHSVQWLQHMAEAPGSPLVVMHRDDHETLMARMHTLEVENDDLRQRYDESQSSPNPQAPIDIEALASALVIPLESHFARKAGRKPRDAA